MNDNPFAEGISGIFIEVIGGILTSTILVGFRNSGAIPASDLWMIDLIGIVLLAGLVFTMFRWGIVYTIGWLFGAYMLINSGLMGIWEIFIYFVLPIIIWITKLYFHNKSR